MNTKTLISGLAGGVVIFLGGYVVYGMIMMNYFMSNMISYPGLLKDPMDLWSMAAGNTIMGILLAYILNLGGTPSAKRGATIGAITFFLIALSVNLVMYAQMNINTLPACFVDSICMALLGALAGAVIGWIQGRPVANG